MRSIRKISYLAIISVAALLMLVIILGIRQYQLGARYNTIITQSEEIIFHFSTIREQITTALIEKDYQKAYQAADQLKNLNSSLARLQENTLIPGEYRLDMAKQVDLSGLAISAKEISTSSDKVAHSLVLQGKMRSLAEYLLQFDRIIVSQMRARLVQFQTVMIGALGTVICLISFLLIILFRNGLAPLLSLTAQAADPDVLTKGLRHSDEASSEVAKFVDSINNLLTHENLPPETDQDRGQLREELAPLINESNNLSNGIINYAQLLKDSYRQVEMGDEEAKIVENIIEGAERIAALNREI